MLYIRLAIDNICSQFKRFIISLLLIFVSSMILGFVLLIYYSQGYGYSECDKLLVRGFENVGIVSFEMYDGIEENIEEFYREVYELEEIYSMGSMQSYTAEFADDILEIQKENTEGLFVNDSDCFTLLDIDKRLLNLCEFEIVEGTEVSKLNFEASDNNEIITYLYLGSAYKSIPVGTEYRMEFSEGSYVYIVAGIMKETQRWVDPSISQGMWFEDLDYTLDCKYAVFAIGEESFASTELWIAANDGYTIDDALVAIDQIANKYKISVVYTTLTELYEASCSDTILLLNYFRDTFIIIVPAVILMLITMQMVSVMHELKTYGIMLANGYSMKDINIIMIIKNIILSVLGGACAIVPIVFIASNIYTFGFDIVLEHIMVPYVFPVILITLCAIIMVTSLTSIIMLKKYTPIELMKAHN